MTVKRSYELTAEQELVVNEMITKVIDPMKKEINEIEKCLSNITSFKSFFQWAIPISLVFGMAFGSLVMKVITST